jgi:hypothetical protein
MGIADNACIAEIFEHPLRAYAPGAPEAAFELPYGPTVLNLTSIASVIVAPMPTAAPLTAAITGLRQS